LIRYNGETRVEIILVEVIKTSITKSLKILLLHSLRSRAQGFPYVYAHRTY